jgi:hypothetical protein
MCLRSMFAALCLVMFSVGPISAACMNPPLASDVTEKFKSNPTALVSPDADTRTIEAMTRDLAGTDASLAADLVTVAKGTTPRFRTAIAAGLAQAAIACSNIDQNAAGLIQEAVAGFEDGQFQASFAAVAGDLSTAATAAAAGYAAASAGSVVVVNPATGAATTTLGGGGGGPTAIIIPTVGVAITAPAVSDNAKFSADAVSATR